MLMKCTAVSTSSLSVVVFNKIQDLVLKHHKLVDFSELDPHVIFVIYF